VTSLRHAKPYPIDIRFWVVNAHEEKLNKEASSFGTSQNIYLARMRHHRLEAEAALGFDACVTATIGDDLRLPYAIVIGALKLKGDVVRIDVLAESDALPAKVSD
jgi:hypothetical protein